MWFFCRRAITGAAIVDVVFNRFGYVMAMIIVETVKTKRTAGLVQGYALWDKTRSF